MNRTSLLIALGLAAVVGLLFGLYPGLDTAVSAIFFSPQAGWALDSAAGPWRHAATFLIALIAAPAFIALIVKLLRPERPLILSGRAIVLMIVTLALGPGLIVNTALKDHWGRPRPQYVKTFRGNEPFLPWWDPRGPCEGNCSFVAGEPSGAFWTLAPAALVPPQWRAAAYVAALSFGALVGVIRIAAGGHFFTDVFFSGLIVFLLIWVVHGLLYRWPATRITDQAVERILDRIARPGYDVIKRVAVRIRMPGRSPKQPDLPNADKRAEAS